MTLTLQQTAAIVFGGLVFFQARVLMDAGWGKSLAWTVAAAGVGYWLASQHPFAFQTQWLNVDATPNVGF